MSKAPPPTSICHATCLAFFSRLNTLSLTTLFKDFRPSPKKCFPRYWFSRMLDLVWFATCIVRANFFSEAGFYKSRAVGTKRKLKRYVEKIQSVPTTQVIEWVEAHDDPGTRQDGVQVPVDTQR